MLVFANTDEQDLATQVEIRDLIDEVLIRKQSLSPAQVLGTPSAVFPSLAMPPAWQALVG